MYKTVPEHMKISKTGFHLQVSPKMRWGRFCFDECGTTLKNQIR